MKKPFKLLLTIALLSIAATVGYGADRRPLVEFKENGLINWTTGMVEANGVKAPESYTYYGKAPAQQPGTLPEAVSKARHNLLETLVSLRIDADSRVINVVEAFPSVMAQLRSMAQRAPEVKPLRKQLYDGTVEVWTRMKLSGGFSQLILPPEIRHIEPIKRVQPYKKFSKFKSRSRSTQIHTGLVVDARGLPAIPVLAPRILDETLDEAFGPAYVSREYAVQHGVVSYATDIWQAKFNPRVGDNPLIIKALKTIWPGRCDFIISNTAAGRLRSHFEHLQFLKECKVVIVLDPL
jgi:hypothetical protein